MHMNIKGFRDGARKLPIIGRAFQKILKCIRPDATSLIRHTLSDKDVYFVQIGANDGVQGDPIHELLLEFPSWRGLFVEPVPFVFERLRKNRPDVERFQFDQVAVSDSSGSVPFFYVDESAKAALGTSLPVWFDQLGSFDPKHILSSCGNAVRSYIVECKIQTVTLMELFERNQISKIDLLHVDTEGNDWKILSQLDFSVIRPRVVLFEHGHLGHNERSNARQHFVDHGYTVKNCGFDFIAIDRNRDHN